MRELSSDSEDEGDNSILVDLIAIEEKSNSQKMSTKNAIPLSPNIKNSERNQQQKYSRRCRRTPRRSHYHSEAQTSSLSLKIVPRVQEFGNKIIAEKVSPALQMTLNRKNLHDKIRSPRCTQLNPKLDHKAMSNVKHILSQKFNSKSLEDLHEDQEIGAHLNQTAIQITELDLDIKKTLDSSPLELNQTFRAKIISMLKTNHVSRKTSQSPFKQSLTQSPQQSVTNRGAHSLRLTKNKSQISSQEFKANILGVSGLGLGYGVNWMKFKSKS